jgi:hypothetical protein
MTWFEYHLFSFHIILSGCHHPKRLNLYVIPNPWNTRASHCVLQNYLQLKPSYCIFHMGGWLCYIVGLTIIFSHLSWMKCIHSPTNSGCFTMIIEIIPWCIICQHRRLELKNEGNQFFWSSFSTIGCHQLVPLLVLPVPLVCITGAEHQLHSRTGPDRSHSHLIEQHEAQSTGVNCCFGTPVTLWNSLGQIETIRHLMECGLDLLPLMCSWVEWAHFIVQNLPTQAILLLIIILASVVWNYLQEIPIIKVLQ